jgi:Leucine-rich repeat (LRR) protein
MRFCVSLSAHVHLGLLSQGPLRLPPALTHATDLSFNHISKIEGLSRLGKLTELSLAHNRITTLEGLQGLASLDVLSVGGNQIESVEVRLRFFRACV